MSNYRPFRLKSVFVLLLLSWSVQVYAQSSQTTLPSSSTTNSVEAMAAANAETGISTTKIKKNKVSQELTTQLGLSLTSISYASDSVLNDSQLQQIEVNLNFKKAGLFFTNTEIIAGTFTTANSFYYALPEAYIGYGYKTQSITFGRKIENYSFSDSFFNFGLVQPYSSNDLINFHDSGLTGLTGHYYSEGIGFNLSYNPLYLPNAGPQVKVVDGQVVTSTRWAPTPPTQFRFGDQNRDIIYAIRDYNITDILFNSGYMAQIYFGSNKQRPGFSFTYGQKPINEIALSRDTFSDIATFSGNVILTPVVLTHEIYATDINIDFENIKTTFSFVGDHPRNVVAPEYEAMQTLSPLSIYSAYIGVDLKNYLGRKFEVYTAGAIIYGGEIRDIMSTGQEASVKYASSRTQFKKPVRAGVKGEAFYISGKPVTTDVSFTYDQQLKGSLLSASLKYEAAKNLNAKLGFDVIGVENDDINLVESNFLDQNKANDRFSAGVSYVF